MKVKRGILVHASKIVDPGLPVVNQNKSKVMMPAIFLNNQSAGTVTSVLVTPPENFRVKKSPPDDFILMTSFFQICNSNFLTLFEI